jgi:hypothetical protein
MKQNGNKNRLKNRLIFYITLIFTLIFGIIGCQNSDKGQYAEYANGQRPQEAAPQKNDESLQGNIPENSVVVEKGNMRYFLSRDGDRSDYQIHVGLYSQEINDTNAERLIYDFMEKPQLAGDFVYFLSYSHQLRRVNVKAAKPPGGIVAMEVKLYSLYDHWAYYWNESDTYLYRIDLTDIKDTPQKIGEFKKLIYLIARGDFVLAVNSFREEVPQKSNTTIQVWKLSPDGRKKDLVMSNPGSLSVQFIQPYQDHIYYLEDNIIWRINIMGEDKEKVYTPNGSNIHSFIVSNNQIYLEEYTDIDFYIYSSVNLNGEDKRLIFNYRSPLSNESSANGTIDTMNMFGFDVTQDYLFLSGASCYHGEILTTRIPIAGNAQGKKEEVFFNGAWRSAADYVKEVD